MRFSLLLATVPFLAYISAAPQPPPAIGTTATTNCIAHIEGLATQLNTITAKIEPNEALDHVNKLQETHKKVLDTCCQASVVASSAVARYTKVAPQVTQALGLLGSIRGAIPDLGGVQESFTQLPDSIVACSQKQFQ
ncbi:hypothetical protein K501DRAFT_274229 [Backusella circina FSU 941]|nr:hypothetical protein K501DRAFT_274229 [Backusella circina FSU 941]